MLSALGLEIHGGVAREGWNLGRGMSSAGYNAIKSTFHSNHVS